jgi:hypothetical protein
LGPFWLPKVNNCPFGENSPNLVTLVAGWKKSPQNVAQPILCQNENKTFTVEKSSLQNWASSVIKKLPQDAREVQEFYSCV